MGLRRDVPADARRGVADPVVLAPLAPSTPLLLSTKLHPPPERLQRVPRQRLIARLDDDRPITVVVAPAGFGKTSLLLELIEGWRARHDRRARSAGRPSAPVAWLSLDAGDNE